MLPNEESLNRLKKAVLMEMHDIISTKNALFTKKSGWQQSMKLNHSKSKLQGKG
jgi:hypothetical protein